MIEYNEEKFEEVIEELKPLLNDHYEEIAIYQDKIDLNPNYEMYKALEDLGNLHVLTARDEGRLVGYCVTFIQSHPHYIDHLFAANDILYIMPDYRHTELAPNMLNVLEEIMKEKEVSVMTFHMKTYKPFETLMDFLAFDKTEHLYTKYIGE